MKETYKFNDVIYVDYPSLIKPDIITSKGKETLDLMITMMRGMGLPGWCFNSDSIINETSVEPPKKIIKFIKK